MRTDQAKEQIMELWEDWATDPNSKDYNQMREFHIWLDNHHSNLLTWRAIDHWQDIQGWLKTRVGYGVSSR